MARANYFRKNAETCLSAAAQAANAEEQKDWLIRAARWRALADEAGDKADDEPLTPGMPRPPAATVDNDDSADAGESDTRAG